MVDSEVLNAAREAYRRMHERMWGTVVFCTPEIAHESSLEAAVEAAIANERERYELIKVKLEAVHAHIRHSHVPTCEWCVDKAEEYAKAQEQAQVRKA